MFEIKRKLFRSYYKKLNERQQEAVFSVKGAVLVVAGAGSGKTTVLVNRIAHIVRFGDAYYSRRVISASEEEMQLLSAIASEIAPIEKEALEGILLAFSDDPCPPDRILAITFTNKAANEMKTRLSAELGPDANEIWAGTFHSVCVRLLRRFAHLTEYGRDFTIYDQDDCKKIITALLKERNIDNSDITPKYVMNIISNAKNALQTPEEFKEENGNSEKRKLCASLYFDYQKQLKEANALDFDDLILVTVRLLQDEEEARSWCQNKFKYIFVDEYQDTNHCQYQLMRIIAQGHGNVMVVGDDDQSIYKFRGAAVENILRFDKQFEKTKVIFLEENYRSSPEIVSAANSLIEHNQARRGKTLFASYNTLSGETPQFHQLEDQEKEAMFLADKIMEYVLGGTYDYKDFAVLYRTRAQANALETVFTKSGIPHRLLAGLRFYDHAEVKDIIAYLRFIQNPNDFLSMSRIINVPRRGIGTTTLEKIRETADEAQKPLQWVLENADQFPGLKKSYAKISHFLHFIYQMKDFSEQNLPSETVRTVIQRSGYLETLLGDEKEEKRNNVDELISSALYYEERTDDPTLSGFLEEIALVSDVDNYDNEANSVVLMTIHAAKGLEFPVVFLVGMEENLFPSPRSSMIESDLEEERRLAYVAMTRAKRQLFMTGAHFRTLYGKTNANPISRFVGEIDPKYLKLKMYAPEQKYHIDHYSDYGYKQPKIYSVPTFDKPMSQISPDRAALKQNSSEVRLDFQVNDRVIHALFGPGTVLETKKYGSDRMYRIRFDRSGEKKLMATYAKLKPEK